ncbi:MAG TPA: hypothetical protein HA282_01350 [Nanoarchaeota archaeon]|nr:MAG: archaeal flagellar protein FlaJ [archaeon GW2011_AR6]MBS3082369.1 type II secretion system F family protein [Candidatus Pacearchaeota archaeon]HIH18325.1 hypothetical protein [Nanoarchaeota archaeon]HIH33866.1 hypothetical protein [Nanoarchaeota archaeon]HIH51190.1 hypothetical protein [Nanoarchaeota archaeon]
MKIPFSILPGRILKRISLFRPIASVLARRFSSLDILLKQARSDIDKEEYITAALTNSLMVFTLILITSNLVQIYLKLQLISFSIFVSAAVALFVFINALVYPSIVVGRRIRAIERNLLPALQDFQAQINSGVPVFNAMVNISNSDYGEVSKEFAKAIREINAGKSQIEVLSDLGAENPSIFFRRSLWQISNGLTSGANMIIVVKESIKSLADEQVIQIQEYGSRLSPLSMFYMLIAVIFPILAVTFITILSSIISLPPLKVKAILWGFYVMLFFFQIMFLGMIKSRRPNLI